MSKRLRTSYATKACTNCQRKHAKCSGEIPCINCTEKSLECCILITGKKRGPKTKRHNNIAEHYNKHYNTKGILEITNSIKDPLDDNSKHLLSENFEITQPHYVPTTNYDPYDSTNLFNSNGVQSSLEFQQENASRGVMHGILIIPIDFSPNITFNGGCNFELYENNLISGSYFPNYNSLYSFDNYNSSISILDKYN
ncbi:9773_t:CDS:1, partial [Scutellospora calospora]